MANDQFAQIAAEGIGGRIELLEMPKPREYAVQKCVLEQNTAGCNTIPTVEKISTKEQLYEELAKMRQQYKPYLENHAPLLEGCSKIVKLTNFVLNGNENITLPHYGAPLGYAVQTYEADFEAEPLLADQAMYIRLKGADYIAFVYINGECVGSHEGFFSPFEFEISEHVKSGINHLKIVLKNDYKYMGNRDDKGGPLLDGDKLYAATGLGYDDPAVGWHHCPPGMGIYSDVTVEVRNKIHITDLFVRNGQEVWVEIQNAEYVHRDISINLSVYGQNFQETVFENMVYEPSTSKTVGFGDSLTQAEMLDSLAKPMQLLLKHGINVYKIPIVIPESKIWSLEQPFLYQMQVTILCDGKVCDRAKTQFGIGSA